MITIFMTKKINIFKND